MGHDCVKTEATYLALSDAYDALKADLAWTKAEGERQLAEKSRLLETMARELEISRQHASERAKERDDALLQLSDFKKLYLPVVQAAAAFVGNENNGINYHQLKAKLTLAVNAYREAIKQGTETRLSVDDAVKVAGLAVDMRATEKRNDDGVKQTCACGNTTFIRALHAVGCPMRDWA